MEEEIFRDVVGYKESYQISNKGNIKSLDRIVGLAKGGNKIVHGRILLPGIKSNGYLRVSLCEDRKIKHFCIHQLVAQAFLGHKINRHEMVINHIDFNKKNNNVGNLEVVTSRENSNLKHIKSSSKYVGVCWRKDSRKWRAYISVKKKMIHLGSFKDEYDAHLAREAKLKEILNN